MEDKTIKVLLIDDDVSYAQLAQIWLAKSKETPFDMEWEDSLSEGLDRLAEQSVDVILLDLTLPDSGGLDTFVRMQEKAPDIPIIMLTGTDEEALALKAVQMGAQDYLIKNKVDGNHLLRSIRYAIERKQFEKALRESEERFRGAFDYASIGMALVSTDGHWLKVNRSLCKIVGYSEQELLAIDFQTITHPDDLETDLNYVRQMLAGEIDTYQMEKRYIHKLGHIVWILLSVSLVRDSKGNPLYFISQIQDITLQKQVEKALEENLTQLAKKNRYESIISAVTQSVHQSINLQEVLENAVDAMSKNIDRADNVSIYLVEGNEAVIKAYRGYPDWFIERVGRIPYPKGFTWKAIIEGNPVYCGDVDQDTVIGPAGRQFGTKSYAAMPICLGRKAIGVININSLQKKAFNEEELKLLEIVAHQIEVAINNARQAESLRQSQEALAQKAEELARSNKELSKEIINRYQIEERLEGQKRELEEAYAKLEQQSVQMIQTEKLSTVGTMAAGVAHELNNPMMGILNFIQYCLKHTPKDDRRYRILQDAECETNRCIDIVRNLLTFAPMEKEGLEAFQRVNCSEVFDRVFKLLSYRIEKEGVSITQDIEEGIPQVLIKPNNIQQVFLNLTVNALDALRDRDKKEIHIDMHREGEFVRVIIVDTGIGIPANNLGKIFDPFFTTKSVGQGTGLGLSICRNIINKHGGEITCESKVGVGTRFEVLLPIERREERKEDGKCLNVFW